ncbi:peroxidase-related enzyme [Komagataeibacter xylinus]|uniref:Peroxidase-related enzyme n=1 Tax=Komagataeibacter xylinus TaxID=28448 RepID=A0A857FQP4_KOMXY|nr:peroxidase-related enzyme [Komagataeibacter xylinus]QHC36522.1 peroxidase-related enzyme [Komagataeibacter xylinus]
MKPVTRFTTDTLDWEPYITPVDYDTATPAQREALQETPSHRKISKYTLTLAHDPESLKYRSPLFNLIMYGKDGLPRAERELAAVATSVVNHCIYCGSVHAARYIELTRRPEVMDEIFTDGTKAEIDEYSQGLFDFAVALSKTPVAATQADMNHVRDLGFNALQALDLVLASAIFGWANRLMHTLGQAVEPTEA